MDKNNLKIELKKQTMSFNSDVEKKLQALVSGKDLFKPKPIVQHNDAVSCDELFAAFTAPLSEGTKKEAEEEKKQIIVDRLMLLRGLPGDYLHKKV